MGVIEQVKQAAAILVEHFGAGRTHTGRILRLFEFVELKTMDYPSK